MILISILCGMAAGFLISTQVFTAWAAARTNGLLILTVTSLGCVILFGLLIRFTGRNIIQELPREARTILLVALAGFTGLMTITFPLPQRLTPDRFQTLVIRPAEESSAILIEEVKINGGPVILADHLPSTGWQITPYGVESDGKSSIPFVIQKKGEQTKTVEILLGKGPQYGQARLRLGWEEQLADLHLPAVESETIFRFTSPADPMVWDTIFHLSIWFLIFGISLIFLSIILSGEQLASLADFFAKKSRSMLFWIVISFLFWYGFAYVHSVFFDASHFMQNGNFLPAIRPIGNDLNLILKAGDSVASGGSPYIGANKYPPFATVLFVPLAIIDKQAAFQIQTILTYLSYALVTLFIPLVFSRNRKLSAFSWLLFGIGLFSYGLSFEIERGQFNLTAIACTFFAIYLFHRFPRQRWLAYILFTFGIQLKLYPAIFILFFVDDWNKWKETMLRWCEIGLANVLLLFILGKDIALKYLSSLFGMVNTAGVIDWPGSHSVFGFLGFVNYSLNLPAGTIKAFEISLQFAVLLMVLYCAYRAYRENRLLDPYLFLSCTLAALTIPALSHDYTLSYLVGPVIWLLAYLEENQADSSGQAAVAAGQHLMPIVLLVFCFTGTFFSYLQKPVLLQNQFPALFIMLVCTALLAKRDTTTVM